MNRVLLHKAVFVTLFVALFFTVRLPFYSRPMYNEDGIFADIFINHPVGPNYGQIARVDGNPVYAPMHHPALLYKLISATGYCWQPFINFHALTDGETTFALRFIFSLFQLTIWLLLIAILWTYNRGWWFAPELKWPLLCVLVLALTPLAIHNSIELQLDSSSGILMAGLIALSLLLAHQRRFRDRWLLLLAFGATTFLGFGKNEWSYAFLAAMLFSGAVLLLDGQLTHFVADRHRFYWQLLACLCGGCLLGNGLSMLLDWENYYGGIKLMLGLSKTVNVVKTGNVHQWWGLTARRLPYIYIMVVLLGLLVVRLWHRIKAGDFIAFLALVYPSVLFVAYAASYWNAEPRYFAPAFVGAAIAGMMYMPWPPPPLIKKVLAVVLTLFALHTAWYECVHLVLPRRYLSANGPFWETVLYTPAPAKPARSVWDTIEFARQHKCVPILDIADCWNKPGIDYIGTSLGYDDGLRYTRPAGRTMCDDIPGFNAPQ